MKGLRIVTVIAVTLLLAPLLSNAHGASAKTLPLRYELDIESLSPTALPMFVYVTGPVGRSPDYAVGEIVNQYWSPSCGICLSVGPISAGSVKGTAVVAPGFPSRFTVVSLNLTVTQVFSPTNTQVGRIMGTGLVDNLLKELIRGSFTFTVRGNFNEYHVLQGVPSYMTGRDWSGTMTKVIRAPAYGFVNFNPVY